jgi:hypothetical protein
MLSFSIVFYILYLDNKNQILCSVYLKDQKSISGIFVEYIKILFVNRNETVSIEEEIINFSQFIALTKFLL